MLFLFQLDELEDKEVRLRILSDEQERNVRLQSMTQEKVRKDVTCIKKQLTHERNLKLDAFQRVDELQATVSLQIKKLSTQHVSLIQQRLLLILLFCDREVC